MQYASKVSAWRRELNTRRGKAANTPGLLLRQIHSHAQAAVTVVRLDGSFKDKGFCARSVCQLREKNLISVSSSGRRGRPWRGRRCHPRRRPNTWRATPLCAEREAAEARGQKLQGMATHFLGSPRTVLPNHSLEARSNGGPPGPDHRYGVHFLWPGPGVPPLTPPQLKR